MLFILHNTFSKKKVWIFVQLFIYWLIKWKLTFWFKLHLLVRLFFSKFLPRLYIQSILISCSLFPGFWHSFMNNCSRDKTYFVTVQLPLFFYKQILNRKLECHTRNRTESRRFNLHIDVINFFSILALMGMNTFIWHVYRFCFCFCVIVMFLRTRKHWVAERRRKLFRDVITFVKQTKFERIRYCCYCKI